MTTVLFDIDTQIDFLYPAGALYVPKGELLVSRISQLNRRAAALGMPVVSTVDAHSEDDIEFKTWPHHCVVDTVGQGKPQVTLLDKWVVVPNRPQSLEIAGAQQIILEKQTTDCFTNVNIHAILEALGAERYLVFGVVTEICVKHALFGLLGTGRRVELVTDAIESLNSEAAAAMISEFQAQGGHLTTSAAFG